MENGKRKKKKEKKELNLTSSISSRETFLLSLLATDKEPESAVGASAAPTGFDWLPCTSCAAT